jgi:endoglucanase Acf2
MEKWVSTTQNIYYFDPIELNNNIIDYINKNNNSDLTIDSFNDIYPRVLVFKNNKVIENYNIKCAGFNCNAYLNNEF